MSFTNHGEELALTWLYTTSSATRPTAWYLSLHDGDPGETGANEVDTGTDADYVRKSVTFADPVAGSGKVLSDIQASWAAAAGASNYTITHVCIWDALSAGNCLMAGTLVVPFDQVAAGVFTLAAGKVVAALD